MNIFFQIALQNILRNKKRTIITTFAVSLGVGVVIFLFSFSDGANRQMVENVVRTFTGDVQILPKALENYYNTNGIIEDLKSVRKILSEDPRVFAYSERIVGAGILSSATQSLTVFISGFDPEQEARIGTRRTVAQGKWLDLAEGKGVCLGEKLRQNLGVEIGDKLVLTLEDYYGALTGEVLKIVGSFETGNDDIDNTNVYLLKSTAQKIFSFDEKVSKIALKISDRSSIESVVGDLKIKLTGTDLSVATWEDLLPFLAQLIRYNSGRNWVMMVIILALVAVGFDDGARNETLIWIMGVFS